MTVVLHIGTDRSTFVTKLYIATFRLHNKNDYIDRILSKNYLYSWPLFMLSAI